MDGPTLSLRDKEGANAIDVTTFVRMLSGRGVVSGGEVHDGSTSFGVDVMATNGWFANSEAAVGESEIDGNTTIGTPVQRGSASVDLREYVDETYPRKVLICLPREATGNAADGAYHVEAGEPAQARPPDFDEPWKTSEPSLPDLDDRPDLIPLAAVMVGANADKLEESNIWQRQQRPDAAFRKAWASELHVASLIDGAGNTHDAGLADASDVTDAAIRKAINTDSTHSADAAHDFFTPDEARGAVRGDVDVAELSGAAGTDGQLPFTNGAAVNWATPPDEWGSLQALVDAAAAAGVTPSFDAIDVADLNITSEYTWPDGTGGTTSPSAQAGNVALLADLGDVQRGAASDRHAPSGSSDVFFATEKTNSAGEPQTRGVAYDNPANDPAAWDWLAIHPGDIDSGDLGFDVATQTELTDHTSNTANPHNVTAAQAGALPEGGTATAADSAATAAKASSLLDNEAGDGSTLTSGQFARSDVNDDVAGIRTHKKPTESIHGERSRGEIERWVGDTADTILLVGRDGQNQPARAYNAYLDNTGTWRYQVSNEEAWRISPNPNGGLMIQTANESLSGEAISWETAIINNGAINRADHATSATRLTGGTNDWKVENGRTVNGSHSDFSTAQQAINYAISNGHSRVEFGKGTFGAITIPRSITVEGSGTNTIFVSNSQSPVIINGIDGVVRDVQARSNDTSVNRYGIVLNANGAAAYNCSTDSDSDGPEIGIAAAHCRAMGNRFIGKTTAPEIRFESSASTSVAIGNVGVTGIDDRGTDNSTHNA